jgi:hypothetical protein
VRLLCEGGGDGGDTATQASGRASERAQYKRGKAFVFFDVRRRG